MGLLSGFAKINDFGVKVLEGGVAPPIRISIDQEPANHRSPAEQAPIATSTQQQQVITDALEKVITAINQADVSEQEKNEAKLCCENCWVAKAAVSVLGRWRAIPRREVFHGIKQRAGAQRFVGSLLESWDSHDKKRSIFRNIRPECTHRRGILHRLRTKKPERLRYETINPDTYAKRTAGRVAATPALQNTPVDLASCTTQAHARCPLEYPHLAVASPYGTRFAPRTSPDTFRADLKSFTEADCHVSSNPHVHRTPGSRFTTICASNIPNGSSQMANPPSVILTTRVSRKCSTL